MDRLVEGFSRVKRCGDIGRGVMSMDLLTLYARAAKVGPVVPTCLSRDKSFVDNFIKAFYGLTEAGLMAWVEAHKASYPLRQVRALLENGLGAAVKGKSYKHLQHALENYFCIPLDDDERTRRQILKTGEKVGGVMEKLGAAMASGGLG